MSKTKSGRHRLSKTDKRLLAALVVAGYEERTARDLIQKHVYTLTQADLRWSVKSVTVWDSHRPTMRFTRQDAFVSPVNT
ncbi:hypothetical protein BN1086_04938 [Citrobacter koseri]|uniref:Uncharacterized protein n=1 Tax=Citrobacter koseri TaxID=545 RepID=A0A078LNH0_CITKO|nr:hypothetical protein BN1086_04938 [Citrobacter koseri]